MASTNQSPEYQKAEQKYLNAKTEDERIYWLEQMIRECPKHKSAEAMLANLKTRLRKLKEKQEKIKKSGKSGKKGIKKADMQAVIIGFANSGKSSLLKILTNAYSEISENKFTTKEPIQGIMNYEQAQIQIIDLPAVESEYFDSGIIHTADTILIIVDKIEDINKIEEKIKYKTNAKKLIIFNKSDLLNEQEKRRLADNLHSKKYNFVLISTKTQENIEELKDKIFNSFDIIRIYTKEPGKEPTKIPTILHPGAEIKDVATDEAKKIIFMNYQKFLM